ncbi:MAG: hypothetical protein FJY75_07980 [Candidatus Eisenbacteria bacterium]|uniref:Uncharacterized protein n=1 Tax=Eiseniibacteriota bacterium TaxID=2212470 RepID=A0A938BNZ3_UNCEI|nr:hypothetical protein [Candidatus Eisenbacteria bacterium]
MRGIAIERKPARRRFGARAKLPPVVIRAATIAAVVVAAAGGGRAAAREPEPARDAFFRTREVEERFAARLRPAIEAAAASSETLEVPASPALPGDVADGVFGYLIGLADRDIEGLVTGAHMRRVLDETGRRSRVPAELIRAVRRAPADAPGEYWVAIEFTRPLRVPVPYSILGYRPGSLASSETVLASEWRTGPVSIPDPRGGEQPPLELEDVRLWAIVSGKVEIDIHGWVDALLGSRIDDTRIIGLAVFRHEGVRYGLALGYNPGGQPRSGALDFGRDEIRFPPSEELKAFARHLRSRVVQRLSLMDLPVRLPG